MALSKHVPDVVYEAFQGVEATCNMAPKTPTTDRTPVNGQQSETPLWKALFVLFLLFVHTSICSPPIKFQHFDFFNSKSVWSPFDLYENNAQWHYFCGK